MTPNGHETMKTCAPAATTSSLTTARKRALIGCRRPTTTWTATTATHKTAANASAAYLIGCKLRPPRSHASLQKTVATTTVAHLLGCELRPPRSHASLQQTEQAHRALRWTISNRASGKAPDARFCQTKRQRGFEDARRLNVVHRSSAELRQGDASRQAIAEPAALTQPMAVRMESAALDRRRSSSDELRGMRWS